MEWARYRDMTRVYLLITGAFFVTFFVDWVISGYLAGGALGAVYIGAVAAIFLFLGLLILYFGLEKWDRFYSDMTVPQPAYQYYAYYQPAYYPPPGYYYPPPAYYPPPYGQQGYGMPAYYPQYPQYRQPAYQYPPAYGQPAPQYTPAYYQPQPAYQPPPPVVDYAGPHRYVPKAPVQPRELDPRRALILPGATRLLALFLLAVVAGGLALAMVPYMPIISIVVFLPAFVIGFSFPSLIWISYVYSFEKNHLLPSKTILKAFVWGMLSTIPAILVNTAAAGLLGEGEGAPLAVTLVTIAVIAPLIEEASKPWGVRLLQDDVRGPLDGLILGVTCGVGFALIENITYEFLFIWTGEGAAAAWTLGSLARGLGSVMIHAAGAGMIGYAYGRYRSGRDLATVGLAYLAAVGIHSAWNASSAVFSSFWWEVYASVGFMLLFVVGTYFLLRHLIDRGASAEMQAAATRPPG